MQNRSADWKSKKKNAEGAYCSHMCLVSHLTYTHLTYIQESADGNNASRLSQQTVKHLHHHEREQYSQHISKPENAIREAEASNVLLVRVM